MRQLHVSVGDQVGVTISAIRGPTKPFTVVGTTIAPWINQSEPFTGGGAIITHSGLQRLIPAGAMDIPIPSDAFVNFAPGAISPAAVNELRHQVGNEYTVELAQPPTELLDFGRVQDLPLLLALLLVGLAAVTLFLTLISSATRRRPELAILKAVGYRPNQLRRVVACQSTVMTLVGLVVGLPLRDCIGALAVGARRRASRTDGAAGGPNVADPLRRADRSDRREPDGGVARTCRRSDSRGEDPARGLRRNDRYSRQPCGISGKRGSASHGMTSDVSANQPNNCERNPAAVSSSSARPIRFCVSDGSATRSYSSSLS